MKCVIQQTHSGLSAQFDILHGTHCIGEATLDNNFTYGGAWKINFGGALYELVFSIKEDLKAQLHNRNDSEYAIYNIFSAEQNVGKVSRKTQKLGFLNALNYTELSLRGNTCQMYKIGLGKQGLKYPIYSGDIQVALIEKDCTVYNNLDAYFVTAVNESVMLQALLLAFYLDSREHGNRGKIAVSSKETVYYKTTKKALLEKWDPNFKMRTDL